MEDLKIKVQSLINEKYVRFKDELNSRLCSTIGFKSIDNPVKGGYSKLGGFPIINRNFIWPTYEGRSMSFMGQIDLEDIKDYQLIPSIPNKGILYFFMYTGLHREYPSKSEHFKVIYLDKTKEFVEFSESLDIKDFEESFIEFYPHITIKRDNEYNERLDDEIDELYADICHFSGHDTEEGHQIGGYPLSLQNPVFYWWSLSDKQDVTGELDLIQEEVEACQKEFILLLQLSFSDSKTTFMEYGGDGIAYFGIKKGDLENNRFDKAYIVCQNT